MWLEVFSICHWEFSMGLRKGCSFIVISKRSRSYTCEDLWLKIRSCRRVRTEKMAASSERNSTRHLLAMRDDPPEESARELVFESRKGGFRTIPFIIGTQIYSPFFFTKSFSSSLFTNVPPFFYFFILWITVNESFEKVASYGLLPNMIFYMLNDYHMEVANATTILFLWSALSNGLALVGAFLSDSYLGRFRVIALGSFSSLLVSIFL